MGELLESNRIIDFLESAGVSLNAELRTRLRASLINLQLTKLRYAAHKLRYRKRKLYVMGVVSGAVFLSGAVYFALGNNAIEFLIAKQQEMHFATKNSFADRVKVDR